MGIIYPYRVEKLNAFIYRMDGNRGTLKQGGNNRIFTELPPIFDRIDSGNQI